MPHTLFQYLPLEEAADEVRLLTLLPGPFSAPVAITLANASLNETDVPEFEALSYAWGSTENSSMVVLSDESGHQGVLHITQNLGEALSYLRYEKDPRTLWIDAICVNQKDLEERSQQVRRMPDIYSKAKTVVVWLGPESEDSDAAIKCFNLIADNIDVHPGNMLGRIRPGSKFSWADPNSDLPFTPEEFSAMENFIGRPWFGRLWIWQEVSLASRAPVVMCGSKTIQWQALQASIICLDRNVKAQITFHYGFQQTIRNAHHLVFTQGNLENLKYFANVARSSMCSDPRDRIFAILSLLMQSEMGPLFKPDYTKSVPDVYKDATAHHIRFQTSLNFLSTIDIDERAMDLPSWVLEMNQPRATLRLSLQYASASTEMIANFPDEDTLQVTGVLIYSIERTGKFHINEKGKNAESELKRVALQMGFMNDCPQSRGKLHAYCRVISANGRSHGLEIPNDIASPTLTLPRGGDREALLLTILDQPSNQSAETETTRQSRLLRMHFYCSNRALIMSKDGQLGLGPRGTKPGDIAVAILGCSQVIILRPTRDGQYLVVGEAYCDGFADGEALLGPLPEPFERGNRRVVGKSMYSIVDTIFRNRETGDIQEQDPRLGSEPASYSMVMKNLESRGVILRQFNII